MHVKDILLERVCSILSLVYDGDFGWQFGSFSLRGGSEGDSTFPMIVTSREATVFFFFFAVWGQRARLGLVSC